MLPRSGYRHFLEEMGYGGFREARVELTENQMDPTKDVLNAQRQFWDTNFATRPEMFGDVSSDPARKALELMKLESKTSLLELGGGQGRDTFFFASNGVHVTMLDYSQIAVDTVNGKAQASGLGELVTTTRKQQARSVASSYAAP